MSFPLSRAVAARLALLLALAAPGLARAQTWSSTTDRNWGVAGNWTPATIPNATTAVVNFGAVGPGAINFATGGTAFTTGAINFTAGGFTLDAAGSLTIGGATPTLTNSAGTNIINSRLTATGLAATISGGTLTLGNVRAAGNSLTGTFTVTGGGTLDALLANADLFNTTNNTQSLGSANVTIDGGTLNLRGNLVAGGLVGQVYQAVSSSPQGNLANINNTHPDFVTAATTGTIVGLPRQRSLFNLFDPELLGSPNAGATAAQAIFNNNQFISQANGQTFAAIGSNQTQYFLSRWSGVLNIATAGNYVFGTRSDDGSLIFIDGNQVANNNFYQGMTTRSVTINGLTAGQHTIDVFYYGGGGGNGLLMGYSGPDNGSPGIGTSDAAIQTATFQAASTFGRQGTIDLTTSGNILTVGGTAASTINVSQINAVKIPTLNLNSSANLTVGGNQGLLRANFTNLTGTGTRSFTINATTGDLAVGQLTTNGGAVTLTKSGAGNLIFDAITTANLGGGTLLYDVLNGRLVAVSDQSLFSDVLGTPASTTVRLTGSAGNTPILQLRTRIGAATFDAALTVAGTGGTVEALPIDQTGFSNIQLGSPARGINISAGTLTVDVFGGGDGTNLDIYGVVSGAGSLLKSIGTGILTFRNGNTYGGGTTVNAGSLIGETNTSFGTGTITVGNGGTLALRNSITVSNTLTINGAGTAGRSGALEPAFATTTPDATPVYAGNITLSGSATIGMAGDSVVSNFLINGNVALGANTLTLNPAGGSSTASQLIVNGIISGTGNLVKNGSLDAVLTNDNTYSGTTTVNVGRLVAQGNVGRAVGAGAVFVNSGGQLLVSRPNALGNGNVTLTGATSNLRYETGGTSNSTATSYVANEGTSINVTGNSAVSLPNTTLTMTGAGNFFGLREGWVRTNQDYTTPNPNNGISGGVVTNIRMASITTRTGGTAAGVDNPGPNNNFAWSDNTTFIYTGQIQARVTGVMQFAEQVDDNVFVRFAGNIETGAPNSNGTNWYTPTSTRAIPVVAGQWYDFEVRLAQGGGGAGPPGSNANGGWGAGWTSTFGFGLSEVQVGDGLVGAATSTTDSTTNPKYIGTNYFKPGEAGDPLFDAATGTQTRFRATTSESTLTIDGGSSFSVKQITSTTGGGTINLNGVGAAANLTLLNQASATANVIGQLNYTGNTSSTFTVGTNHTVTITGGISTPAAALTSIKAGSGNIVVNGATNFGAGSTFRIDGGTVRFNGTGTGTGTVLVQSGAGIGGSGTLPGPVSISTGASLAPGNSVGKLSTGNLTLASGTTYFFEYSSDNQTTINGAALGTVNDAVAVTGTLALPNVAGGLTINILATGFTPTNTSTVDYTIATATTAITGYGAGNFQFTGTGFFGTPQALLQGTNLVLRITPVPEPASVLVVCAGAAGMVSWIRRRRVQGRQDQR
ncbi:MAG: PA14 domain-containing protein [Gemmataceae bacterium]